MAEKSAPRTVPWRFGTIVELSPRGYGFLVPDDGGQQVFFHFRAVEGASGSKSGHHRLDGRVKTGERVMWQAGRDTGKGPRARVVRLLTPEEKLVAGEHEESCPGGAHGCGD